MDRIEALDATVFSSIEAQTNDADRRALLAIHCAVAQARGSFAYLEIGSYLGGSLQAVMRDPRCSHVVSIDPRPESSPDTRSDDWTYLDNSLDRMLALLGELPGVDMGKLVTLPVGTDSLQPTDLSVKPDYCFIDGEHTDEAASRDARFCAAAVERNGIIAFHDYELVKPAIRAFVRDEWVHISSAIAFGSPAPGGGGGVLALELGDRGVLRNAIVDRAVASRWHSATWRLTSRSRLTPIPFLLALSMIARLDVAVVNVRTLMRVPRAPKA